MAAAASNKPSPSRALRRRIRPRNGQSCKTSRDGLPPEQVKSTHQRVSDSSDRMFYKLVESLTARIQVLEDRDQAHAHPERQQYGSRHETTHISDVNANRSLYKILEAALTRLTVLETRRDICYRHAFKATDGEECMIRGCSTTSSSPKNAIRHIKNTATPEHEVAALILQQTKCLQCDQQWERPSGLAHHEMTVHQEICSSRIDAFKPFIEQSLYSIPESQSTPLSPPGSDILPPFAYNLIQPSWSSFNDLQLSANPTPADAPSQPWQPGPDSLPLANPTFVHGSTHPSSPKVNNFPLNTRDSMHLDWQSPEHPQLSTDLNAGNNITPLSHSQFFLAQPQWSRSNDLNDGGHY